MEKTQIKLNAIKLVGISVRTSNMLEMEPDTAKIALTASKYFSQTLSAQISNRANPGVTYCSYTNYENNETEEYTYFIGEEVDSFENIEKGFATLTIPFQTYMKFTVGPGIMPNVCMNAWKEIWQMEEEDFSGKRAYIADFEVYDKRAIDSQNTILDLYIDIV